MLAAAACVVLHVVTIHATKTFNSCSVLFRVMRNIAAITQKMDKDRATVFDDSSANALHSALEAVPHMAKGLVSIINKFSLMPSQKWPPHERFAWFLIPLLAVIEFSSLSLLVIDWFIFYRCLLISCYTLFFLRRNPHNESYVTPSRTESQMKPNEAKEINSPK